MTVRHIPRARDDEVLAWINLRCAGHSTTKIGRMFGKAGAVVTQTTNNVKLADIAESGEADAAKAYWRDK